MFDNDLFDAVCGIAHSIFLGINRRPSERQAGLLGSLSPNPVSMLSLHFFRVCD